MYKVNIFQNITKGSKKTNVNNLNISELTRMLLRILN